MKNFLFNSLVLILLVPISASFLHEMGRQSSPATHQIIEYINADLPEDSVILTLRQADFAFKSKRKFIADFDERLLPLFETKNENQLKKYLDFVNYHEELITDLSEKISQTDPEQSIYLFGAHIFAQYLIGFGLGPDDKG